MMECLLRQLLHNYYEGHHFLFLSVIVHMKLSDRTHRLQWSFFFFFVLLFLKKVIIFFFLLRLQFSLAHKSDNSLFRISFFKGNVADRTVCRGWAAEM